MVLLSPVAHGTLRQIDTKAALEVPGVHAVLTAADVPGENNVGPVFHDEPVLAEGTIHCKGQPVAAVIATSRDACREALARIELTIDELPAVLTIDDAVAAEQFHGSPHLVTRGDATAAIAAAPHQVQGTVRNGGQDHFYLETHCALVTPGEDRTLSVLSSTQHPSEVQHVVAEALGLPSNRVVCEVPRMGGAFGGKESQASPFAAFAALGAWATGRPCRCWLHRDQDMAWTGKRHPFLARWKAAFAQDGRLLGFDVQLFSNGGWTVDLSGPVMDRALFHADSAYHIPAFRVVGRVCATNLPSNTAFRGFGGPQGMVAVEAAIDEAAAWLGLDPTHVRRRNLYGPSTGLDTPFGQAIEDCRLVEMTDELLKTADYAARRDDVAAFNAASTWRKRGIALQPVKFGISFTASLLNQAGALVLVYTDGTVQVNHGGTEMGQGLHTKIRAIAADAFGIPTDNVRVMTTATDKVPNTSATAASSGSDLNGAAVARACAQIHSRLSDVACRELNARDPLQLRFADGQVTGPKGHSMSFRQLARTAWAQQVSLAASGYYATPGIAYDPVAGRGRPFFYFAFGVAMSEVEVCGLTGQHRLRRVDILHDVGNSLIPSIDIGQVEGAFVQGAGWLTSEELRVDDTGRLLTHGPSTYKIPTSGDVPLDLRIALLPNNSNPKVVRGSKAVGEPPFNLGLSVVGALRSAISAFHDDDRPPRLMLPATPEAVLRAIERADDAMGEEAREVG